MILNKFIISALLTATQQATKPCDLHGQVRVVQSHADYKVRVVKTHGKAKVKVVERFPDDPGEWMLVPSHADFTIQFVQSGEDFTVQFVQYWPGCVTNQ